MLNVLYSVLEDSLRPIDSTVSVYSGSPLMLKSGTTDGTVTTVSGNVAVYGLAKFDQNAYANFANGEAGAYGSGRMTIIKKGIVQLYPSVYQDPTNLNTVVQQIWDTAQNYIAGAPLYVNSGLITNQSSGVSSTLFGKVIVQPSATNGGVMTVEVDL